MTRILAVAALLLVVAHTSHAARPGTPAATVPRAEPATPVNLRPQPGTALDVAARQLAAKDIGDLQAGDRSVLVLVGSATLASKPGERPALFVQVQSARQCGSAGCSTLVYLWRNGSYVRVLDGVDGPIAVSAHHTLGMADLLADQDRYVWDGTSYRDATPGPAAPNPDIRPRKKR